MSRSPLPFDATIATPCEQLWAAMPGTALRRHCSSCQQIVHNFAEMTPREIERLIVETGGHLCGHLTHTVDGAVVTRQASQPTRSGLTSLVLLAAASTATLHAQSTSATASATLASGSIASTIGERQQLPALVTFSVNTEIVTQVETDAEGAWKAELQPGRYDVRFALGDQSAAIGIRGVEIKGETFAFNTISLDSDQVKTVIAEQPPVLGEVAITVTRRSRLRHPFRYLNYLRRRYL